MTAIYPLNQIAAGYNNSGGLTAWENLVITGEPRLFAPVLYGMSTAGEETIRGDGTSYFSGFLVVNGFFGAITQGQLFYVMSTFCSGGFSGFVSVNFRLYDPVNYYRANAVLHLTQPSANKKVGQGWEKYKFSYTRVVAF